MSEKDIQKAILDYLAAKHVLAFRMNSGQAKMGDRYVRFGVQGMADILAFPQIRIFSKVSNGVITPLPVWIECKDSKGKQSELQKSFQAQVEDEGHRYILARSIEDVEDAV
jgi:hypothetical protein